MNRNLIGWLLVLITLTAGLSAHDMQPAYLELKETPRGMIDVTWKLPFDKGKPLPIGPAFPDSWQELTEPKLTSLSSALLIRWRINPGEQALDGAKLSITGPPGRLTDVLVRAQLQDGRWQTRILRPEATTTTLLFDQAKTPLLWDYVILGIEHILLGFDHLLFVLCLVLLVRDRWTLLKTVTAFTIAHSVTLAASTLGWAEIPGPPVEAVIALSIVFLARELALRRDDKPGLTERYPWLVALTFGLLHGFGFAGALSEIGLPTDQIPLALFNFNVGVELGQLAFVAVILLLTAIADKLSPRLAQICFKPVVFSIGIVAAYWCVERISGFWA